jgi:hypothetical protein
MRFARVPESLLAAPVSDRAFRVLVGLLLHADREGRCHPKNARLVEATGMGLRTVQSGMAELASAGVVEITGHTRARTVTVQLAHDQALIEPQLAHDQALIEPQLAHDQALIEPQLAPDRAPISAGSCARLAPDCSRPLEQTIRTDQEQREGDSPLPLIPAPHDPLATQADRLADAEITRRWGEDGVQIYRQAQSLGVGLAWMLPAVEACHTSKGRYVPTYVAGIVRGYRAEGGPPAPPVAGTVKRKPLDPFEAAKEERAKLILAYREANRK